MSLAGKTALVTGGARRVGRAIVEELARRRLPRGHPSPRLAADAARALPASLPGAVVVQGRSARSRRRRAPSSHDVVAADRRARPPRQQRRRLRAHAARDDGRRRVGRRCSRSTWRADAAHARRGARRRRQRSSTSSTSPPGSRGPIGRAYATSKAALLHLSRCLALELAPRTRVNCVAPGHRHLPRRLGRRRAAPASSPRSRSAAPATPADVARVVRFLCEEEYLTGACIPVDGGAGLR